MARKGVQKPYDGETLVVKGVDLRVAPGEFLTRLGPSGSGKTTILMMLAGFETPTAGEILLDGQAIAGLPSRRASTPTPLTKRRTSQKSEVG